MSPGNLYYHFKSKEQLVEWLFRRLEQDIAPFTESCASLDAIDDVWLALHLGFETVERYRFLFADVEYLLREYPRTGERMKKLTSSAIDAISAMCHSLARAGVIVAEAEQIDSLAFHIVFTATCWETFVKLMPVKDVETARTGMAAGGEPLPEDVRGALERSFRHDLSAARVHTGGAYSTTGDWRAMP